MKLPSGNSEPCRSLRDGKTPDSYYRNDTRGVSEDEMNETAESPDTKSPYLLSKIPSILLVASNSSKCGKRPFF